MPTVIEELWIFSRDGVPIADFCKQGQVQNAIIGSFISAIKSFGSQLSGKELKAFSMGDFKFTCRSAVKDSLIVCCRSHLNIKDKKINKLIAKITDIFEGMYSVEDIQNWNGDLSFFDKFRKELNLYVKLNGK